MSPEIIIAFSTTVIALAALGVALWQGIVTRQHNRLSVTPHLRIDYFKADDPIKVILSNKGNGPALITSLTIMVDGEAIGNNYYNQMVEALDKINILADSCCGYVPHLGDAIGPGETVALLEFPPSKEEEVDQDHIAAGIDRLTFRVNYESIYRDKFVCEFPPR